MTTVGEISVKISADLAPLRKAQAEAKKIMGEFDAALNKSAQLVGGAFGTTWGAQVSQFNAGATKITTNLDSVASSFQKTSEQAKKGEKPVSDYVSNIKSAGQFSQQAAFQFNDLFVQLASGQSAFTAITQQGAQLAQMFEPGTGIGAAAKNLGGAFVQFLINPLNLAVVAIAGVAAAVPMIWEAVNGSEGESAEKTLSRINDIIKEIEKTSPKAAEAVQKIMDAASGKNTLLANLKASRIELEALLKSQRQTLKDMVTNFGGLDTASNSFRVKLKDALDSGTGGIQRFRDALSQLINDPSLSEGMPKWVEEYAIELLKASEEAAVLDQKIMGLGEATRKIPKQSFVDMQQEMENLRFAYEQGIISLEQYNATLATLDSAAVYYQEQAFRGLQTAIDAIDPGPTKDALQEIYDKATDGKLNAEQFREAIKALGMSFDNAGVLASISGIASAAADAMAKVQSLRANGSVLPTLGTLSPLASAGGVITADQIAIQNDTASRIKSQTQIQAEKETKKSGGSKTSEKDRDYIETLRIETEYLQKQLDLMGLSYDARVQQQTQLDQEKAIREAIVRLGEKATPEQIAAVKQLIPLQQQLTNELAKQKAVQDTLNDAYVSAAGDIGSAIAGAIQGTENLGQAFAKVALKIAEAVIQAQILQSFTGSDGKLSQGGSIISSLVKGIFGGFFAEGGTPPMNKVSVVGEEGPELFVPKTSGVIVPNNQLKPSVGGGGNTQVEITLKSMTDSSVITEIADTQVQSRAPAIIKASVQQSQQQTKQNMPGYLANAQTRSL